MMAGEKRQMTSGSKAVKTAAVTSAAPQNFEKNPAQPHRQEIGPAAIYKAACIYLSLPLFIFLGGWLDGGWAALFLLLTATAFYKMYTGISCQTHLDASTQTSADISCKTNAGISADEAVNIPSPLWNRQRNCARTAGTGCRMVFFCRNRLFLLPVVRLPFP